MPNQNKKISNKNLEASTNNNIQAKKTRSLWRAVIMQAVVDASNKSSNKRAKCHKMRAKNWLSNEIGFIDTCMLADMDPSYVQMKIDRFINK